VPTAAVDPVSRSAISGIEAVVASSTSRDDIRPARADDATVVAALAAETILAASAEDAVAPSTAEDRVMPRSSADAVDARSGEDHVVAPSADDSVITAPAADDVGLERATKDVIALGARDRARRSLDDEYVERTLCHPGQEEEQDADDVRHGSGA